MAWRNKKNRGASITEYAIILGFVAIIAVFVSSYNYSYENGKSEGFFAVLQLQLISVSNGVSKFTDSVWHGMGMNPD